MCYHLTPIRMAINKRTQITNVGEDAEKREPLYTTDGKVDWYSHFGKEYRGFSKKKKKLKTELPYDPSILLMGMYPNKNTNLKRYMNLNVNSIITYICQDMGAT